VSESPSIAPRTDRRPSLGPIGWAIRRFSAATEPASAFPLVVLFFLYFADEFDTSAFNTLAPEIKRAFHLSASGFTSIVGLNLLVVVLLTVPLGWFADRTNRVRLVWLSALVAASFSVLTGLSTVVFVLVIARIGNGIGLLANDPVHTSLLTDYYHPASRPHVFGVHRSAPRLGAILGPFVAGVIGTFLGWRASFFLMAIPIVVVAILANRLREPVRGATDSAEAAAEAALEEPVSFSRGVKILNNVPTLRRQFISSVFLGAAVLPFASLIPLYLDEVFHVGQFGRGVVGTFNAAASFGGVLLAGHLTRTRWLPRAVGEPQRWGGRVIGLIGVGLLLYSVAPRLWIALPLGFVMTGITGMYYPPILTTTAMVAPARVRSQAFTFFLLYIAIGAINLPIAGAIADDHGVRWGLAYLTPFWLVAGVIISSAHKFVAADAERALQNLLTTVALRRERLEAGARSLLVCRRVDVAYGQTQVLFGIDLSITQGEVVAVLGTNGAGKSTLLKAICGSVTPFGGAIFFDGRDVTVTTADRSAAHGIVLVPGGQGVFPGLTVEENFTLAGWLLAREPAEVERATEDALGYFPVLRERWKQRAGNLSGGEQQMLTIAMALLSRPRLLMIDELTLGLAPLLVDQLLQAVRSISQRGVTVLLVEQSVNVALTLAGRTLFIEKGEIRFDGPTSELLKRPDVLRSVYLEGAAKAMGGRVEAGATRRREPFQPVCAACGRGHDEVLTATDLAVSFGGIRAVSGVSISVRQGEVVGLIGPNGAGKTTIFDLVCGFLAPERGRVIVDGTDVSTWPPDARARAGLGRSFQDARMFPSMTVEETIAVYLERRIETRGALSAVLLSPATHQAEAWVAGEVERLIELMGLGPFVGKFVAELSTGTRRIVDLACALALEPKVLLLDEPSSGIAQRETEALQYLLLDIREKSGAALLVIEHDMPLITAISDRIIALDLGSVIAHGEPHEVMNDPRVVESYLGQTDGAALRPQGTGARRRGVRVVKPRTTGNGATAGADGRRARTPSGRASGRRS
jgi:branched-chain amino acid transport system ATP-binding protein